MNSIVKSILGEDVPVPVAASRQRSDRERIERLRKKRSREIAGVLGMTMEDENSAIIPKDAEEIENTGGTPSSMAGMAAIKEIVAEPTDPYSSGEKAYSPATALVAPDVTPNATKPLDPSKMPGVNFGTFNSADAAPPAPPIGGAPPVTGSPNALDILLGRRPSAASTSPPTMERTDNVPVTVESAAQLFGVVSESAPQAPPTPKADIRRACDVARRYMK